MPMPIITMLSDFGLRDPYVAEMKAVILSICPGATIIDLSHEVRKFDVRMGAFILASAAPYFPPGTVHVAVVDPGVGTRRRPLIVETPHALYVGPDNGILMLAAQKEGISHVREITSRRYMLPEISRTFHGRDIFSCAAAHLAMGVPSSEFGPEIHEYVVPTFARPSLEGDRLLGEIIYTDDFGNLITNISAKDLKRLNLKEGDSFRIKLGDKALTLRLCSAYGEVPKQEPLAIIGGSGFLEVAVNQGNASETLQTKTGDPVSLSVKNSETQL
ncbi:MAG: S-adenosyl-l-methionine hydroxide adenosyltransferase family protein [Candidatus Bathyarchaeia archaeon]